MTNLSRQINGKMTLLAALLAGAWIGFPAATAGAAAPVSRETPVVRVVHEVSPAVVNISSQLQIR
jgi:hypothetical protein